MAEWDAERKKHEEGFSILRVQIGKSERQKKAAKARKQDAFDALREMTENAELSDKRLKGE